MIKFTTRIINLVFGLFLYALGAAITMKANLGYAPWDVFHQGIAQTVGLSIGRVSILAGLVICVLTILLGEKFGIGTILNMLLIGLFLDWILSMDVIPQMKNFFSGLFTMATGLFIIAVGSYFYINAGFGAGPRDSLMVAVKRKTGLATGISRILTEGSAVLIGWLLGGPLGLGTVIAAFGIGLCIQIVFSLFKFDPTRVRHETVDTTFQKLKSSF
ncbi:MAG: hypothetical protein GX791_09410 [Synergistaceae bacterium]|nr:hypothetical protein [Synergistaceae bacterium]